MSSWGVSLAPAFLPALLALDLRLVGFFFEAATLAVFFFVARCVALPGARFAAAFFLAVPFFFFVFFFTGDFFAVGVLTAVARLAVFLFVRTTRRPRPAGADASFADVSPASMSMPKTDDNSSDLSRIYCE